MATRCLRSNQNNGRQLPRSAELGSVFIEGPRLSSCSAVTCVVRVWPRTWPDAITNDGNDFASGGFHLRVGTDGGDPIQTINRERLINVFKRAKALIRSLHKAARVKTLASGGTHWTLFFFSVPHVAWKCDHLSTPGRMTTTTMSKGSPVIMRV